MDASEDAPVRYDDLAEGYARHWGPVIRPAAEGLLEHVPGPVLAGTRILDVGTGTGALAIAALARWPGVAVTGVDPSGGMLEIARREAREQLPEAAQERLAILTGLADRLPVGDATFDVALSSFVLQLVPNRAAALREMRRVLRPGGRLAWVTWLVGGGAFRPDEVVDEVLGEFGFDPPEHDERSGDLASVAAASSATRRAGFREVRATAGTLRHTWTANGYAAFIAEFDEETLFGDLERGERRRLERRLRERLGRLTPDELTVRLPIVYVSGVAPGGVASG